MRLGGLVLRNAFRSPIRAMMTVCTVALLLTGFVFPRTLVDAQEKQVRESHNNRIIVQPKVGWGGALPARYADEVRATPGVRHAVGGRWAGLKVPGKDDVFFSAFAIEPHPFIAIHQELNAPVEQKQAFMADERSAIVSIDLARQFNWKIGDRVIFQSRIFPGEWEVNIACIYDAVGGEWAKRSAWVHYGYFNRSLPVDERDKLAYVSAQIVEPNQGGRIARALDLRFDASPVRTLTLEDRVQTAANIGRFRALLICMGVVSLLILIVALSILANTLAMNVRERSHEFATLRAIGFGPLELTGLVVGEAGVLGLAGTALGICIAYPLIESVIGPFLQEALQFPPVKVPFRVVVTTVLAGGLLALLSAALPAHRLARLEVAQAIRRVA